jgi:hypothetical protein
MQRHSFVRSMRAPLPFAALVALVFGLLPACDQLAHEDVLPAGSTGLKTSPLRLSTYVNQPLALQLKDGIRLSESSVLQLGNPSNGQLKLDSASAVYTYVPNLNYTGEDSLRYKVCAGGKCDSSTVVITVKDTVRQDTTLCKLVANPDYATARQNDTLGIAVLNNDQFCGKVDLALASMPANGLAFVRSGAVFYQPNRNFAGQDSLSYTLCNGAGPCVTTWVSITVQSDSTAQDTCFANLAARADASTISLSEKDSTLSGGKPVLLLDVLLNDTYCPDLPAALQIVEQPLTGKATVVEQNGRPYISYVPAKTPNTTVQLKYRLCNTRNGKQACGEAKVDIKITE